VRDVSGIVKDRSVYYTYIRILISPSVTALREQRTERAKDSCQGEIPPDQD
jgi:hypothetical protein